MGYTHYWRGKPNLTPEVIADIEKIVAHGDVSIVGGLGDAGSVPTIIPGMVRFNGEGDDSYETFDVSDDATSFSFCKTARMPYDPYVCAALIRIREASPDFVIESDGDWDDADEWGAGRALYADALGRETTLAGLDD